MRSKCDHVSKIPNIRKNFDRNLKIIWYTHQRYTTQLQFWVKWYSVAQGWATIFVRGQHLGQKGSFNATKIGSRGLDVARGPYVAPSCSREMVFNLYLIYGNPAWLKNNLASFQQHFAYKNMFIWKLNAPWIFSEAVFLVGLKTRLE